MRRLVFAEYTFIFDPDANTWSSWSDLERDLSDFLVANGLEANIVETGGTGGKKAFFIERLDKLDLMRAEPRPVGRPKSISSQLKEMSTSKPRAAERNFNKGKFLIRKGYLKREI